MNKTLFSLQVLLLTVFTSLFSQVNNPWVPITESVLQDKKLNRQIIPLRYKTFKLDIGQMKSILREAPLWQTEEAEKKEVLLTLPMPDGQTQEFQIMEAPVMHPDLARKFPAIKSYAGYGLDDPTAYVRFDLTEQGFHAMVLTAETSTVFIDPYAADDLEHYIVYYKSDYLFDTPIVCGTDDLDHKGIHGKDPLPGVEKAGDCKLRTYTLALACTGEYAQYHGGTVNAALSAMNTTITRVSGIFERDLSVHLELHPNTDQLIYLNASTDPFTNNDGYAMLAQNQTTCDAVIGSANYDFGHVFSTGGGGVAYVGIICYPGYKAGGVTGLSTPVGDPFDVDYVSHEMGHQFGANHTQNNNCSVSSNTSMEPGSGSTVMGYAGVCAPNVQGNSDDYFHAISLQEIAAYVTSTFGNGCATTSIVNNAPTAAGGPDYVIPKSTPFFLTGTATDPDPADSLTYTWEQMDKEIATMPPLSTNANGPMFRSYKGTTSPVRYFPRLQDVVNNATSTWEVLPSVARTLNFRLTVRDNRPGAGCTKEDDVVVTVSNAGPFVVTAPNTAVTWQALTQQTVTWNVAGTASTPVSCANVDILLSLDGGYTYPVTLLAATPNDGSQVVTIPDNPTNQARIMVKGTGNIFYDISNVNFTISDPAPDFTLSASPNPVIICPTTTVPVTVTVGILGAFSGNVTLSNTAAPNNVTATWSSTQVAAPGTSTLTLAASGSAKAGNYSMTLSGVGSTGTKTVTLPITITALPSAVTMSLPAANATGVSLTPTLTWNAVSGATSYEVQVSTNSTFTNIVASATGLTTTSYTLTTELAQLTVHYWRVRAYKACGPGAWPTARSFTTLKIYPIIKFEHGIVGNVNEQWQTVTLNNNYTSMVVVASVVVPSSASPSVVTRVQNAAGNSFQLKVQIAGNATGATGNFTVHYMVAEEGVYTLADNGVKFEVKKHLSTKTSRFSSSNSTWVFEPITFSNTYTKPVVVGQVMTYGDPNWSVFWASKNGGMANPPAATSCSIGKHIAQDNVNLTRANETLGYMVFENGTGTFNGKRFVAILGGDNVKGITDQAAGYSYTLSGFTTVEAAVVSSAAQDATEGGWAVLATTTPLTTTSLKTWALEDQITDTERSHTADQVAYVVMGTGSNFNPNEGGSNKLFGGGDDDPSNGKSFLIVYPNPVLNELTVEYNLREEGQARIAVFDLFGKVVILQEMEDALTGFQQTKLDVSGLPPGCYVLQVMDGAGIQSIKFIRTAD